MMIMTAFAEGLIWSVLWILYVYLIMRYFPWMMLHDYPEDVRKASTLPEPTDTQNRNAKIFSAVGSLLIFGSLLAFGLLRFHENKASLLTIFTFLLIIAMCWNVIDLLVMDWLLVCTIRPAWLIIPGTEKCSSYGDYGHHFKGFLIGCVYSTLMALLFAGIDYAVLNFILWR